MEFSPLPLYIVAALAAAGFAALAWFSRRSIAVWALLGGIYGLTVATIVVGIGHSIALPYSRAVVGKYITVSTVIALILVGITEVAVFYAMRKLKRSDPISSSPEAPVVEPPK